MPAPNNAWSHYISVITQIQNRVVREDFRDVGDDDWEPDISTPRSSLRTACTIRANDSAPLVMLRLILYYVVLRKAQDMQIPYYGMPIAESQATFRFKPQVTLYFLQSSLDYPSNKNPVTGTISFRLMDETSTSITNNRIKQIANLIKTHFGGSTPFIWKKGKLMVPYNNWEEGIAWQILSLNATQGERVIKQLLKVQGSAFESRFMNINTSAAPAQKYPQNPGNQKILGESIPKPRQRPVADVVFRYATLSIHGRAKPIHLYDRTNTLVDVVVK